MLPYVEQVRSWRPIVSLERVQPLKSERALIAFGVMPPPISGKVLVTRHIFDRIRSSNNRKAIFVEHAVPPPGFVGLLVRVKMTAVVLFHTAGFWLRGERIPVYLVAEGGAAVIFTALSALFLRAIANPLVIHHHGRYWLERRNPLLRMTLFCKSNIHVTQCASMSSILQQSYGCIPTASLTNAFVVGQPRQSAHDSDGILHLAHLSNLTIEKGLGRVIATFEALKRQEIRVTLRIGGIPQDSRTRRLLIDAVSKHPEIEWRGQVDDDMKDDFFEGVSAFLFPTEYKMETEGIVTLEALARSIPVIATDLCCLRDNLSGEGGIAIPVGEDFVSKATEVLQGWSQRPDRYWKAREAAKEGFENLLRRSQKELNSLMHTLDTTPKVGS